jgi:hypothetical protein
VWYKEDLINMSSWELLSFTGAFQQHYINFLPYYLTNSHLITSWQFLNFICSFFFKSLQMSLQKICLQFTVFTELFSWTIMLCTLFWEKKKISVTINNKHINSAFTLKRYIFGKAVLFSFIHITVVVLSNKVFTLIQEIIYNIWLLWLRSIFNCCSFKCTY